MQYYDIPDIEVSVYLVEKYGADEVDKALKLLEIRKPYIFEDEKACSEDIREAVDAYFRQKESRT